MVLLQLKSTKANPLAKLQKIAMVKANQSIVKQGQSVIPEVISYCLPISREKLRPILGRLIVVAVSFHSLRGPCNITFLLLVGLLCAEGAISFMKRFHAYFSPPTMQAVDPAKNLSEKYSIQPSRISFKEPSALTSPFKSPHVEELTPPETPKRHENRSLNECRLFQKDSRTHELHDSEIVDMVLNDVIPIHSLEKVLDNPARAVQVRRAVLSLGSTPSAKTTLAVHVNLLPHHTYDFAKVVGRCAENVVGYMPIPLGIAGPLIVDGLKFLLPMATTEGALIASTSRGVKALNAGGGVSTVLIDDGMSRAPVFRFPSISSAAAAKRFIDSDEGFQLLKDSFAKSTSYGHLISVTTRLVGSELYIRFKAYTGDAMGMNIVGKGVAQAIQALAQCTLCPALAHMALVSLSGNVCADKKAAAINWIEGRGKSVSAEAVIPAKIVKQVLKCDVKNLIKLNISKNLVGSALAGCAVGGFNAQAANVVAAIFIATGQDPAQVVASSNCITLMEETPAGDLKASVTMPSIEVGIVGGGTVLEAQSAMLDLMGARESSPEHDSGSGSLARVISAAVLAGELSLCSALVTQDLIKSHMALNRKN